MPWFWNQRSGDGQSSKSVSDNSSNARKDGDKSLFSSDSFISSLKQPDTLLSTIALTSALLISARVYRKHLRRIPTAAHLPPAYFHASSKSSQVSRRSFFDRPKSLFGIVTSVGDADNFRLYHTPAGIFGLFPPFPIPLLRRTVPGYPPRSISPNATSKNQSPAHQSNQTIHIRIAGMDAPELAHFGRPAQPYSTEALAWLKSQLLGKRVRVYAHRSDQYGRVVGSAYMRKWGGLGVGLPRRGLQRDIGLEMIQAGLATVYEAKFGAEFGDKRREGTFRDAEEQAKRARRGMWQGGHRGQSGSSSTSSISVSFLRSLLERLGFVKQKKQQKPETPREYKTRMAQQEGKR
ncbi:MAG: putative endonuclease lcl3 [Alyxoria varia]|nr:MAG: putative endonuclease lcl3 [Alyxoria varia]